MVFALVGDSTITRCLPSTAVGSKLFFFDVARLAILFAASPFSRMFGDQLATYSAPTRSHFVFTVVGHVDSAHRRVGHNTYQVHGLSGVNLLPSGHKVARKRTIRILPVNKKG